MDIHRLAFSMVDGFGHAAAGRAQFIIGVQKTVAGNQLHQLVGAQQPPQAVKMVKQTWIDRLDFIGAIIAKQMVKPYPLYFIATFAVVKLGLKRFIGIQVIDY